MKKTIALPVPQAKEGRKTSALENYLIRFFRAGARSKAHPP